VLAPVRLLTPRLVLRPADEAEVQRLDASWQDAQVWAIWRADSGVVVGCVALRRSAVAARLHDRGTAIEPLVTVRPEHRGRGYAEEALKAALWHAQSASRGRAFVAVCDVPNTAADRLLRRVGFVPGYEADGGRWRVRHYRLPLPPSMVAP
jgi:RimJ/RimL family protein N-acetyltransferase